MSQDFIIATHSQENGADFALKVISDNFHDGGHSLKHFGLPKPLMHSAEVVTKYETYTLGSVRLEQTGL